MTANDFTGKTVIPFATSSSSGMGQSGSLLADMAGTGDWQEGQRFSPPACPALMYRLGSMGWDCNDQTERSIAMSTLFINGSPNKNGNTAALAAELLKGKEYETLNLTDYTIGAYGQNLPGDGLDAVINAMKQADTIVIGSPVYWHNICGSVRNVLDRFYGKVENGSLSGRRLYFVFQGAAPEKWMLEAGEYTMKRFAALYGMTYGGMATNKNEAAKLTKTI